MNDYDAQEEFTDNFDIDALIEKLEKANIPDEAIEELEYSLDY